MKISNKAVKVEVEGIEELLWVAEWDGEDTLHFFKTEQDAREFKNDLGLVAPTMLEDIEFIEA